MSYREQQEWVNSFGQVEVIEEENDRDNAELYTAELIEFLIELRNSYAPNENSWWIFGMFGSPSQEHAALNCLIKGLQGEGQHIDLMKYLNSVFLQGEIGAGIRDMVEQGYASIALGKNITTVTEFITAVQEKINQNSHVMVF